MVHALDAIEGLRGFELERIEWNNFHFSGEGAGPMRRVFLFAYPLDATRSPVLFSSNGDDLTVRAGDGRELTSDTLAAALDVPVDSATRVVTALRVALGDSLVAYNVAHGHVDHDAAPQGPPDTLRGRTADEERRVQQAELEFRLAALERARADHQRSRDLIRHNADAMIGAVGRFTGMRRDIDRLMTTRRPHGADALYGPGFFARQPIRRRFGVDAKIGAHVIDQAREMARSGLSGRRAIATLGGLTWQLTSVGNTFRFSPADAVTDVLTASWPRDVLLNASPKIIGQSIRAVVDEVHPERDRVDTWLAKMHTHVRELNALANEPFPQRDELSAVQHQLHELRGPLSGRPEEPTTTPRRQADRGGLEQ